MAVPGPFFIDFDETKPEGLSQNVVEAVCVLGWGRRIVWETVNGSVPSAKRWVEFFWRSKKIQLIFLPLEARRAAAIDGLLNDATAPTKYANLDYTVIADSPLLGFIQIDEEVARNGHTKNSTYLTGQTRFQRDRLVLDWYYFKTKVWKFGDWMNFRVR